MKLEHSLPALTEAALTSAESRLGCSLPESYRRFLRLHNGGFLNGWRFGYDPDLAPEGYSFAEDAIEISEFFALGESEDSKPLKQPASLFTQAKACHTALAKSGKKLPDNWLWIARTSDEDEIFLSVAGADAGSVYLLHARDEFFAEDFDELFNAKGQLEFPEDLQIAADFQRFLSSASPD